MCLKFDESLYFGGQNVVLYCVMRIISFTKFTKNHFKKCKQKKKQKQKEKQINKQTKNKI